MRIAVSRSHQEPTAAALVHALGATPYECGSVGLKVALVLSNQTALYAHTGKGAKLWDGCAPHAIAVDATLVSHNSREFSQVPGLRTADWLKSSSRK